MLDFDSANNTVKVYMIDHLSPGSYHVKQFENVNISETPTNVDKFSLYPEQYDEWSEYIFEWNIPITSTFYEF